MKNLSRISVIFVISLFVMGMTCVRYVPVHEEVPVLDVPDQPEITIPDDIVVGESDKVDALIDAIFKLKVYIEMLEKTVEEYNKYAEDHNKLNEDN